MKALNPKKKTLNPKRKPLNPKMKALNPKGARTWRCVQVIEKSMCASDWMCASDCCAQVIEKYVRK